MNLEQYIKLFNTSDVRATPVGDVLFLLEILVGEITPPLQSDVTIMFAERKAILAELVQQLTESVSETPPDPKFCAFLIRNLTVPTDQVAQAMKQLGIEKPA